MQKHLLTFVSVCIVFICNALTILGAEPVSLRGSVVKTEDVLENKLDSKDIIIYDDVVVWDDDELVFERKGENKVENKLDSKDIIIYDDVIEWDDDELVFERKGENKVENKPQVEEQKVENKLDSKEG